MDVLPVTCDFQRYGPGHNFLLPCREFIFVSVTHLVVWFFTMIQLTQYLILARDEQNETTTNNRNIRSNHGQHTSLLSALLSISIACVIICLMVVPFHPHHRMPSVLLITYALVTFVWLIDACVHLLAYIRMNRNFPLLPFIPSALMVLTFLLVVTQRWISFGPRDPRTLLNISILILHILFAIMPILSDKFFCNNNNTNLVNQNDDAVIGDNELGDDANEHMPLIYNDGNRPRRTTTTTGNQRANLIAHIYSELFFCWINPLLQKGYKRELKQVEDVFHLPPSLDLLLLEQVLLRPLVAHSTSHQSHTSSIEIASDTHLLSADSNADNPYLHNGLFSFAPILFRTYGCWFVLLGAIRLVGDLFKFASPVLLHLLITSLQDPNTLQSGYFCSALMFLTMFISCACDFHFGFHINMLALRAKAALLLAVYEKLLRIPAFRLTDDFSTGKLINLMCTDVDRIAGFITSFHAFWSMPMNFAIALYLLYREIGLAFLAGLAASVLLIPLNKYLATKIGFFSNKMMQMKDARMKLVSELAHSMRTVKLNNWEEYFEARINAIRKRELACLRAIKYLDAICVYTWAAAPIVITVLMLVTYSTILHEQLTAAKVFTTLALINILILPLNAFPWVLSSIINGLISKRRFDSFFAIKCFCSSQSQQLYVPLTGEKKDENDDGILLRLEHCSFGWNEVGKAAVKDIVFLGNKKKLIGVVGPVGSGKSTLLMGILAECPLIVENSLCLPLSTTSKILIEMELLADGFAYVGQDIWLRAGTVRDNIICEQPFDADRFQLVIDACALSMDIQQMPGKENYRISGDGITLSGGQKVRLALARALYANKRVYLLDDPFAALDRTVARYVYENCVKRMIEENENLVILCTHHEEYLMDADMVIRLDQGGAVKEIGTPDEVLTSSKRTIEQSALFVKADSIAESSPMEAAEFIGSEEPEEKEKGAVKIQVYRNYVHAIGTVLAALLMLSLFFMQTTKNGSDIWLGRWASAESNHSEAKLFHFKTHKALLDFRILLPANIHTSTSMYLSNSYVKINVGNGTVEFTATTNFYLFVYIGIAVANSIFTFIRAFLFAYGCILAARHLHERLLHKIFGAKISWWDQTPCGRVTNRLSSDVAIVDDALPFQLNILLASLFSLIGTLLVTVVALPLLIPMIVLLFFVYFGIQRYYRRTTVELKRITALSLSPLYSHLAETVSGLVSVRAFRITEKFSSIMRHRLADNLRAQFSSLACSQWLSVRIQMLGVSIVTIIAFASVLDISFFRLSNPGLIALAITYALSFTNLLNGLLTAFIETEKELVSVERICDYTNNVPSELADDNAPKEAVSRLLCRCINGQIRFSGVSLRYGPELPFAIRDVSFHIEAGHRVALIGRTGSGKSTILQALLRAHPIETGKIHIDEIIDLDSLDLKSARSLFGYVSQHPFLFSGTLRENLCVDKIPAITTTSNDEQILEMIAGIGLSDWFGQLFHAGLETEITENGRNLSFGERQLICLLRLAFSRPKIILIDEATAHMDERTHLLMNRLIMRMGSTVIAIIHRLIGLADEYDWIIEMSNGQIARQGPPALFISNNNTDQR